MRSDTEQPEKDRRRATERRRSRRAAINIESLEGRALLAGMPMYPTMPPPVMPTPMPTPKPTPTPTTMPTMPTPTHTPLASTANHGHHHQTPGVVTKTPHFYQFYTGPKWPELNAVKASAELSADGSTFTFTGTNQGRIHKTPAVYVWGIDRSGSLSAGPFTGRPNIKFDAVVVVSLTSSLTPTVQVTDLASGVSTNLPSSAASIQGKTVSVTVPSSLLPSTGLAPSQFRFNFWPTDGGSGVSSSVASFVPESTTAQVGTM